MKLFWGRLTGTGMASAVLLLLCLAVLTVLAACGGEQTAPVTGTPVPVGTTAVSGPSASDQEGRIYANRGSWVNRRHSSTRT